jgi:multiple sugar transport system substrate-binding protein
MLTDVPQGRGVEGRHMPMSNGPKQSRRQFLAAAGVGAAGLALAACGSSSSSTKPGVATPTTAKGPLKPATITFTTWAGSAEETAFKKLVAAFESANPTVKVTLDIVPYAQILQDINARLQADNPPDIFRVTYTNLGLYSSKDALLDLSPYVPSDFKSQFNPAYYAAIEFGGKPFGIPHQTDTTCIVYNKNVFTKAGITSVPDTLASAWTWEEFLATAKKVQAVQPSGKYAFAYDWQQTGAYRWLSWLFQAGGNLLEADLKTPAIDSAAGLKAMDFTQGFFEEHLVPKDTSTGSSNFTDTVFLNQTVGMAFAADFLLPQDIDTAKFPWGVTYMPQDVTTASDLGGNGIVAAAQSKQPEAAAAFLQFLATESSMSTFCALTNELPTRTDLASGHLPWAVDGSYMPTFVAQATTLKPFQVQQVTVPAFGKINTALQDQLDAAFVGGQSASATLKNIAAAVSSASNAI